MKISKESAWLKQTAMSFRSNVTRKTPRALPFLRGQPRTPPSGDNLGVLDYHLE